MHDDSFNDSLLRGSKHKAVSLLETLPLTMLIGVIHDRPLMSLQQSLDLSDHFQLL